MLSLEKAVCNNSCHTLYLVTTFLLLTLNGALVTLNENGSGSGSGNGNGNGNGNESETSSLGNGNEHGPGETKSSLSNYLFILKMQGLRIQIIMLKLIHLTA